VLLHELEDSFGDARVGCGRGRAVHHQDGIGFSGAEQDLERAPVAVGIRIADNVHQIGVRPRGRQHADEAERGPEQRKGWRR
jgi:hypothetical protein